MKILALSILGLLLSFAYAQDTALQQQDVNTLLWKINEPLQKNKMRSLVENFEPLMETSMYTDEGEAAQIILQYITDGSALKKKSYFSLFNNKHRNEALMLFETLLNCKNWDPCIRNNLVYFREVMNEGVFVYSLYVTIYHSMLTRGILLPPLYEVTPHMFTNSEVIHKAYSSKMTQTSGKFKMAFTGSQKNPEQRVAYFGEDIGMNVHHVTWHMEFPFWWKDSYGYNLDRKGELFFWVHHQLSARFDAERLSNNLNLVDELYWDRPIYEGFAPQTVYKYGGEFPARPDNVKFEDVEGVAKIRDLKIWEYRIRDAIAHGYVTGKDGSTIDILNDKGIDVLGDLIESSEYSVNPSYYGALHNTAHIVLGRQGDPLGKFNQLPGVMEHFETATRDPAFFRLHKYMDNIFKELKDRLPPYTKEEFSYEGIELLEFSLQGTLETFFEDFEFSLINAVDDTPEVEDVPITAVIRRLNHRPFSYKISARNDKDRREVAFVRLYLCPDENMNGIFLDKVQQRWGCIEMEKYWMDLEPGITTGIRNNTESSVTIPDPPSFETLIKMTDAAVDAEQDDFGKANLARSCGIPDRLLLPKGSTQGLNFKLMLLLTNAYKETAIKYGSAKWYHYGGTHAHCGLHGINYPDKRPMGFPYDRPVPDWRVFTDLKTFKSIPVKIYHKSEI